MIQLKNKEVYRQCPFEEIAGILQRLSKNNEVLLAKLGNATIALPLEMESTLRPLMGQRLAILRTDIPGREYLVHICEEIENHDMESAAETVEAVVTETNTHQCKPERVLL